MKSRSSQIDSPWRKLHGGGQRRLRLTGSCARTATDPARPMIAAKMDSRTTLSLQMMRHISYCGSPRTGSRAFAKPPTWLCFSNGTIIVGFIILQNQKRTDQHRHVERRTEMQEFLTRLFSSDFMPHGYCYLWNPGVLWLHAISDGVITLAYYLIPLALVYFVRKRSDLPFHWMF